MDGTDVPGMARGASKPMKILLLTRYTRKGASSRLRTMQFVAHLEDCGIQVDVSPFFDDGYLDGIYAGRRRSQGMLRRFARRIQRLINTSQYDAIWLEYEILPAMPWPLERLVLPSHIPLITDYDDAVFHRYDMSGNAVIRAVLGHKIDRVMAASSIVVAGNDYIAQRARKAGAQKIVVIPTVLDVQTYTARTISVSQGKPVIGWIGSPSTWSEYAAPMMPLLSSIADVEGAVVRAVGAAQGAEENSTLEVQQWSEETEVSAIRSMDIGIMPLMDSPWAQGKCGYKLIQYMACGLPVVASPVGVNADIVEHGVNGFLATTDAEWREALTTLLRDPALRQRMGAAGRQKVEMEYSLQVWGPRMADLFHSALKT